MPTILWHQKLRPLCVILHVLNVIINKYLTVKQKCKEEIIGITHYAYLGQSENLLQIYRIHKQTNKFYIYPKINHMRFKQKILILLIIIGIFTGCKKDEIKFEDITFINSPTTNQLKRVIFITKDSGIIVGGETYTESTILHTTNAGNTWTSSTINNDPGKIIESITATKYKDYAVGIDGKIYYKNQNSNIWNYNQNMYWEWMRDIALPEPNRLLVISGRAWADGHIYMLDSNFQEISRTQYPFELTDIASINTTTMLISGYGSILKSTDKGKTWHYTNAKGDFFKKIFAVSESHIWTCGYNGSILKSTDGGDSWKKQRNGNNPTLKQYHFNSIYFLNTSIGFVVGDNGTILLTKDGGENWLATKKVTNVDLYDVTAIDDKEILVIGDKGTIFKLRISDYL